MAEQFERRVVFMPAFDRRHEDPSRNYGIHGVECHFYLIGEQAATQFVIYTNWQLPEVTEDLDRRPVDLRSPHLLCRPMAVDLGYHRLTPAYEGQKSTFDSCEFLGGRPCYYDGSMSMAKDVFEKLLREGDAAVWRELERFYRRDILDEGMERFYRRDVLDEGKDDED
jgi:hypothetical protein